MTPPTAAAVHLSRAAGVGRAAGDRLARGAARLAMSSLRRRGLTLHRSGLACGGSPAFGLLWSSLDADDRRAIAPFLVDSRSQLAQDLFVVSEHLRRGLVPYFVEVGAADGEWLSNTWLLEAQFGWNGLLVEPARTFHDRLAATRRATVDHRCVTATTGDTVRFGEVAAGAGGGRLGPELSSIRGLAGSDWASGIRSQHATEYAVQTVTLTDLLAEVGAPATIGYLSVDTEGGDLDVLRGIDFARYRFQTVSVEHSFRSVIRGGVRELLTAHGYRQVHAAASGFDDWYVSDDV